MDANAAFVQAMRKEFPNLTILDVTTTFHGENMSRWGDVYKTRDNVVLMVFRTPEHQRDVLQYVRTHTGVRDQTAFADLRWMCMHRSASHACVGTAMMHTCACIGRSVPLITSHGSQI